MAQAFIGITPVDVTPGVGGYEDVDCSSYIPVGATGGILHIVCSSGSNQSVYIRKNGSTDDYYYSMHKTSHFWTPVGVDGNRIFEAKIESTAITIYLVGYTMTGCVFLTNAIDKTPGTLDSWQDVDCSSEAPSAKALFFHRYATWTKLSLRPNGSTDNIPRSLYYNSCLGGIVGCDSNQVCECYNESSSNKLLLIGYAIDGVEMYTNAEDISLSSTTTWVTKDIDPNAVMAFIDIKTAGLLLQYGLRENGSSEDIHLDCYANPHGVVTCDGGGRIQGYVETTGVDFYVLGYSYNPISYPYFLGDPQMAYKHWGYLFGDPQMQAQWKNYITGTIDAAFSKRSFLFGDPNAAYGGGGYIQGIITVMPREPKPIVGAWFQRLSSVKNT